MITQPLQPVLMKALSLLRKIKTPLWTLSAAVVPSTAVGPAPVPSRKLWAGDVGEKTGQQDSHLQAVGAACQGGRGAQLGGTGLQNHSRWQLLGGTSHTHCCSLASLS